MINPIIARYQPKIDKENKERQKSLKKSERSTTPALDPSILPKDNIYSKQAGLLTAEKDYRKSQT